VRPRRGVTLLELLLVTAILGLVASLGAGAVVRAAQGEPLAAGAAALHAAEARARLLVRSHGPGVIAIERDTWWLATAGDERRRLWREPEGLRVVVRGEAGRILREVPLDAAGRGPDLRIELADGQGVRRFAVLGLSGQWVEAER